MMTLVSITIALVLMTILTLGLVYRRFFICPSKLPRQSNADLDSLHRASTYMPPYPSTWYHLCNSSEVVRGRILQVDALGKRFALWRCGEEGTVSVFDAFCPHNGANLATGRLVHNDCQLECPFHRVQFAGDGQASVVPWIHDDTPAVRAVHSARVFHSAEHDDMIFIWFDEEGVSAFINNASLSISCGQEIGVRCVLLL
jgi:phenylpropionate dioxygenase-like ring-hydroxylating dioxygenase large terminal subunit